MEASGWLELRGGEWMSQRIAELPDEERIDAALVAL
jgi:hypothetical protein